MEVIGDDEGRFMVKARLRWVLERVSYKYQRQK